jgi:hypothetical protein
MAAWTAAAILATLGGADAAVETVELALAQSHPFAFAETHHVQGLAADADRFYASSVERGANVGWMFQVDRADGKALRTARFVLGPQYHPGGMQLRDGKLYVPLAEYRPKSTTTILVLDANDFRVLQSFPVRDHIGAVAVDDRGGMYAANWDAREIYFLNAAGEEVERRANPTGVAYQDVEWRDGRLWGCGNAKTPSGPRSVVDVVDVATWKHVRRFLLAGERRTGGSNFSREGFTLDGRRLLLLPEDGPNSTVYVFETGSDGDRRPQ